MSLVGTRPPTLDEWEKYELHHRARLAIKPGITGMWQVSGRSDITDFEEVVKLDILDNEDIVMKSAGTQMCSYNYIGDCASAIITVLINGKCGEAYNTANPDVRLTIAQLAEIIASAANRKVVFADPDDVDLAYRTPIAKQVLSSKKLENLGWSGVFSAEIGVKHTLDILLGK